MTIVVRAVQFISYLFAYILMNYSSWTFIHITYIILLSQAKKSSFLFLLNFIIIILFNYR